MGSLKSIVRQNIFKEASSIGFLSSCIYGLGVLALLHQIQIAEDARVEV